MPTFLKLKDLVMWRKYTVGRNLIFFNHVDPYSYLLAAYIKKSMFGAIAREE